MHDDAYKKSKTLIIRGVALLLFGSALLLLGKLPVPELFGFCSGLAGGFVLLCGNGSIIYGLLVFAGNQKR